MGDLDPVEQAFRCRAAGMSGLGLGLSVDVYSPDLFELMDRFRSQESRPDYLEIFRATTNALHSVRRHMPSLPLAYHGEGLWITQPDFPTAPFVEQELDDVAAHLAILESPWLNHECATKQMAGYSFGTYLPPLYTPESARVVAGNISLVQKRLDREPSSGEGFGPLFLLEMPPLTYFMVGTMSVPRYFQLVTQLVPCGLVLDVGHLWTVYRYTAARHQSVEQFVEQFLDDFPMERVIELHVAGLGRHEASGACSSTKGQPEWIDAHAAPIQPMSWSMLEQVLAHPRLINLRAVALEVDTKPTEHILAEFHEASLRVGPMVRRRLTNSSTALDPVLRRSEAWHEDTLPHDLDPVQLQADYSRYAQIVTGQQPPTGPEWQDVAEDPAGLDRYIHDYLRHEVLEWGGAIGDMFPETCRLLDQHGVSLDGFVRWWFRRPRPVDRPYDFFLLKIDRVLEFIDERAPALLGQAGREADLLRTAYADINDRVRPIMEPTS